MPDLLNFAIDELKSNLDKYGIEKTWRKILATHLRTNPTFSYILQSREFAKVGYFGTDLIRDLSIGDISVLYEFSVSYLNDSSRKSNGQYFTPDDVAIFMASKSKLFGDGTWLDPCSGIGNLSWHLVSIQKDPENFLIHRLKLSDKDPLALLIARTVFTLSFQKKFVDLFHRIEKNFVTFDFLSVSENCSPELFGTSFPISEIPVHDYVIVNPPYLATEIDFRFETANSSDLYSYFLENIIKTSRGFISVTPQSFTNALKFESLRSLLLRKFQNLTIYNFDNVPANLFKGIKFGSTNTNHVNSTRAAIMIAIEGHGSRRISPLVRWKSDERHLLFQKIENHLSEVPLTDKFFPKVDQRYRNLYFEVYKLDVLGSLISPKATNYPLYIPSAPRYFISALITPVSRASQKCIYFRSAKDRNFAYLLINSSFFYWWWRVRDGGMTLSLETLVSVPLLQFVVDEKLVSALKRSEKSNKVYKMNAGAAQENVKHPLSLLKRVNDVVIPKYSNLLIILHQNSDLSAESKLDINEVK